MEVRDELGDLPEPLKRRPPEINPAISSSCAIQERYLSTIAFPLVGLSGKGSPRIPGRALAAQTSWKRPSD
jgi:hypothetical protein